MRLTLILYLGGIEALSGLLISLVVQKKIRGGWENRINCFIASKKATVKIQIPWLMYTVQFTF